jgi:hypothetical protein
MLYTIEELARKCHVTPEFVRTASNQGGMFEPSVSMCRRWQDPIELYDNFDALMLLWISAFVEHGWSFYDAVESAEELVSGYFEDAENQNFPWDTELPPEHDPYEEDEQDE